MSGQFIEITAYKCEQCGQILTTRGGLERHCKHCQHEESILEGQVCLYESGEQHQSDALCGD